MTVLKRKMFRKKGGSKGTGIMASGPEIIKASNGVFNVIKKKPQYGVADPRGFDDTRPTRIPSAMTQFPTGMTQLNTSFIPTGDTGFGKDILDFLGIGKYYDMYQSDRDLLEDERQRVKNVIARSKNKKDPTLRRVVATQGTDLMETQPEKPGFISDTKASISSALSPDTAKSKEKFQYMKGEVDARQGDYTTATGSEADIKPTTTSDDFATQTDDLFYRPPETFLSGIYSKLKKTLEPFKKKFQKFKKEEDKVQPGEGQIIRKKEDGKDYVHTIDKKGEKVVVPLEKEINKQLKETGQFVYDDDHEKKLNAEDMEEVNSVINNINKKNSKASNNLKKDRHTSAANEHLTANKILGLNQKNVTSANIGKALGFGVVEDLTLDDRKNLYANILESTIGDKGDIKTDKDFNLIMTGLLIAAGDSPDALTNISRGLAQGFKMFGDAMSENRKEKRELQLAATKLAIQAEESAKERVFKKEENRLNRVTTVINKMIDNAGKNHNKFGQALTTTVAANIDDYMTQAEYANFVKASDANKINILNKKIMGIYNASSFKNQPLNFDTSSIIQSVLSGNIPKNIQKETNTNTKDNKVDTTSGFKSGSMKIIN